MDKLRLYRKKVDEIDKKIVRLLMLRFRLMKHISTYKKTKKIKVLDKKRELRVLENIRKFSDNKHKTFVTHIFKSIIKYSKRLQR